MDETALHVLLDPQRVGRHLVELRTGLLELQERIGVVGEELRAAGDLGHGASVDDGVRVAPRGPLRHDESAPVRDLPAKLHTKHRGKS